MGGCTSDPWVGAPSLPDPPARTEWWSLAMHGRVVGSEQRVFGRGTTVTRRRTFHWLVDGDPVVARSSTAVACSGTCRWTSWEPGSTRSGTSDGQVPELWPPSVSGELAVLDPASGVRTVVHVDREPDRVRWATPGGPATVWLARGQPVRSRLAGFEAVRIDGPIAVEPVDIARLLALPAPAMPNARRSLVGVYSVDGREVRVDVPSWLELPPERDQVRALVLEVADRIDDAVVPGASTDALRGDCTEHALALVERARLAGFEARTAAGRVGCTSTVRTGLRSCSTRGPRSGSGTAGSPRTPRCDSSLQTRPTSGWATGSSISRHPMA
jgi:hypothetical protein